jgi:NAD(P)-dependent dehydrogenase (short-subunit alcohol dehydrogenase family)
MLMSVIEGTPQVPTYPELAGKRVLITGLTSTCGVEIVRAFAEHKARLVLQSAEDSVAMETVAEIAATEALDIKSYGNVRRDSDEIVRFAKAAVTAYGGLDVVVNLVPLDMQGLDRGAEVADVERQIARQLAVPFLISQIAANRMSLTLTDGLVLNVALLGGRAGGARRAFATLAKAALTDLTRAQAEEWAGRAIRFNAIAPAALDHGAEGLSGEPDIAVLALHLASSRGANLSGCVFEAEMDA